MKDPELIMSLRAERETLVGNIAKLKARVRAIDGLLATYGAEDETEVGPIGEGWEVSEVPAEPFPSKLWPQTAMSTMEMVRRVLREIGREATSAEIRDLVARQFALVPARTLAEMLYKRGSKNLSGLYRVARKGERAKYGLLDWEQGSDVSAEPRGLTPDDFVEDEPEHLGGRDHSDEEDQRPTRDKGGR
jgi:hypothetical protein